jgi:hypothetical protein
MTANPRGFWTINSEAARPTTIERSLAIPDCAQDVEVATEENGALVVSWHGLLYCDSDVNDSWEVTLSPDGGTIHVRIDVDGWGWLPEIQDIIRVMTRSRTIYVHLCMGWTAKAS